jgi:sugar phosphate isomerase/epimerase
MKPISLQLYTVRDEAAVDFPAVLRQVAEIGYKGVEMSSLHGMTAPAVRALLDDLGLEVSSGHMAMPTAENAAQLVDECQVLGVPKLISGFGPDQLATMDGCLQAAAQMRDALDALAGSGIGFGIHNHYWEWDHQLDGQYPEDILLDNAPGAFAELDVYWAACGGVDVPAQVARLAARLPLLHIKDGPIEPRQPMTAVGAGKLDMPAIVGAADPSVLEWLVVELDSCATDMMQAVADSYRYLVDSGLGSGNK